MAIDEVVEVGEKSSPSSEFDDVFDVNYTIPLTRSHKTNGTRAPKVSKLLAFSPQ